MAKKLTYGKRTMLLLKVEDWNDVVEIAEQRRCSIQAVLRGAVVREIKRQKREHAA